MQEQEQEQEPELKLDVELMSGVRVAVSRADGRSLGDERGAVDLIGDARSLDAAWAAVPVQLLAPHFFELRTGVAGAVMQKFAQYGVGLALVGDIDEQVSASRALRDLVRESNRGRACWFVASLDELRERMARQHGTG